MFMVLKLRALRAFKDYYELLRLFIYIMLNSQFEVFLMGHQAQTPEMIYRQFQTSAYVFLCRGGDEEENRKQDGRGGIME